MLTSERLCIAHLNNASQSTLGAELAALLGVPFVALDTLFWQPGWRKSSNEEFRTRLREMLDQSERGWVVDGNYTNRVGNMIDAEATDTVCKSVIFSTHPITPSLHCSDCSRKRVLFRGPVSLSSSAMLQSLSFLLSQGSILPSHYTFLVSSCALSAEY